MASRVTFVLLTASLLLQCVYHSDARPQEDTKEAEELNDITKIFTSSSEEKTIAHSKLKIAILHKCAPLLNFTMHEGKKVFQNTLKDSEVLTNPSDELETQLGEFTHYVGIVDAAEKSPERVTFLDIVEISNHFKTLVGKYDLTTLEKPSPVEVVIEAALKKNGLPELNAEFNKRFLETVPQFNAKVDAYLDSLTPEQRAEGKELSDWYESFKKEQDVEKKRKIFAKLFTL